MTQEGKQWMLPIVSKSLKNVPRFVGDGHTRDFLEVLGEFTSPIQAATDEDTKAFPFLSMGVDLGKPLGVKVYA